MAEEVIHVSEEFYVLATSPRIDDRTRALKHGDTFAVFDRFGDAEAFGTGEHGLYHQDTRFLSRMRFRLDGRRPLLLSSSIRDDNALLTVDATNTDVRRDDTVTTPRGTVHVFRAKFLWNRACFERFRVTNYGDADLDVRLSLAFDADFADIFEVRGAKRERRGRRLPPRVARDAITYAYEGLDARTRRTRIAFDPPPDSVSEHEVHYDVHLPANGAKEYRFTVACEVDETPAGEMLGDPGATDAATPQRYEQEAEAAARAMRSALVHEPDVSTSNEQFNDWLNRSVADLQMTRTETAHGPYPYAGIPWYCTPFGRDGIITALECLSFDPELSRGVLQYLAANQAEAESPENDAQPGKILHETRAGEMAVLGEVPFRRYYGTVDATPLFVMLAGAYHERTGDLAFLKSIWPNVERALTWIDVYGDVDGDGFVEYARRTPHGLLQQGWKDSHDSVFHADGSSAKAPIALCEVQGYVYAARLAASGIARALGDLPRAQALADAAQALRRRFDEAFWCDELGTYALALDGEKRACRVRTSNAGHCLYTGIATDVRARTVATTLVNEASFSGWGIRTLAVGEPRYNPMSYHNGSVWPHDNALIAAGFARYGLKEEAARVLTGLFDASIFLDMHRLPELFCGFPRRSGEAPTLYPVACAPQAWASGAVLMLLESCLGMRVSGAQRRIVFAKPHLPPSLQRVTVRRLRVGAAEVDLLITRHEEGDVGVIVLRREGPLDVVVEK